METQSLLPHFFRDVGKKRAIHAIDMLRTSSVGRIREILLASRPVESDPEVFLTFIKTHLNVIDSYLDHIYWALSHMKQPDLTYVGDVCKKWQGEADIQEKGSRYRSILHFIQEELLFRQPKPGSKKIGTQTATTRERVGAVLEKKIPLRPKIPPKTPPKEPVVRIPKIKQAPKLRARKLQNASPEVMQSWYLSGPDFATGNTVSGKSVVQQLIIQGNFRTGWTKYVKSITEDIWKELGYKFPLTIPGMPDDQGHLRHTNEAMLEFFKESDPQSVSQLMQVQKKNSSVETSSFDETYLKNMKRWYHQGYIEPKTNQVITGKTIIQQCIATKKYAKALVTYAQTLDAPTIESMGFAMRTSLSTNFRLLGMDAKDMKLESLLKTLGETDIETMLMSVSKQHRKIIVSPAEYLEKLKNWYHQGYPADSGETRTGREIIRACVQDQGGYIVNFRSYVNSISPSEQKHIGVRFHTSFTGIFNYLGKDPRGTLLEFLQMVEETDPDSMISELKRPLRAAKTQGNSQKVEPQKIVVSKPAPAEIQPKKEFIGEVFGDDIPENLRYGLRQCFLKIRKCMGESMELGESDIGVVRKKNEFSIVFRTDEIYEKIKQNGFAVEQAVEEANESVFRMVSSMNSKAAKGITYVAFSVSTKRYKTETSLMQ